MFDVSKPKKRRLKTGALTVLSHTQVVATTAARLGKVLSLSANGVINAKVIYWMSRSIYVYPLYTTFTI
jgi:hypothetical protein